MSDIQDPLIVLQHRMQQRQILAMMGINQWVQPSSEILSIADIAVPTTNPHGITQAISSPASTEQPSIESPHIDAINAKTSNITSADAPSSIIDDESISHYYDNINVNANDKTLSHSDSQSPITYSFDTTAPDISNQTVTSLVDTVVQHSAIAEINNIEGFQGHSFKEDSFKKVAPFDLQGGRYGNWVILIDIQALNNDSQKLWQNITQALSIDCETTSFPICEGMDTAELANASFAGYVFKIGRSEEIQVLTLTALPDGLEHPNLTTAPTLDEMLTDSRLKRQLWQMISSSAD